MSETAKVTYATLTAENEQLHAALDVAIAEVMERVGGAHSLDTRIVSGTFQAGIEEDGAQTLGCSLREQSRTVTA